MVKIMTVIIPAMTIVMSIDDDKKLDEVLDQFKALGCQDPKT